MFNAALFVCILAAITSVLLMLLWYFWTDGDGEFVPVPTSKLYGLSILTVFFLSVYGIVMLGVAYSLFGGA